MALPYYLPDQREGFNFNAQILVAISSPASKSLGQMLCLSLLRIELPTQTFGVGQVQVGLCD